MIRIFIFFLFIIKLNANLINGIALSVNDHVITLYDIDETMIKKDLSMNQAVSTLIDEILYKQELRKFNITVNDDEIASYLERLAQINKMSLEKFKTLIKKQNPNYNLFLESTKKRILNQKLINKIASGRLKIASNEDLHLYYENNIKEFKIDKNSIKVFSFEQVKNKIFNIIMGKREQKYLKKYFETLKLTADIKKIR